MTCLWANSSTVALELIWSILREPDSIKLSSAPRDDTLGQNVSPLFAF